MPEHRPEILSLRNARCLIGVGLLSCGLYACSGDEPLQGLTPAEQVRLKQRMETDVMAVLSLESPADQGILQSTSRLIDPLVPEAPKLVKHLERVARRQHALGIAAVQVGIPVRLALVRVSGSGHSGDFKPLFNPEIISAAQSRIHSWENCLSIPWGYRLTERASPVTVRYQTLYGSRKTEIFNGETAVVFQQELDHLNGVLLNDSVPRPGFIPAHQMDAFNDRVESSCRGKAPSCAAIETTLWRERAFASKPGGAMP